MKKVFLLLCFIACCAWGLSALDVHTRVLHAGCSAQQAEATKICNEDRDLCDTARSVMAEECLQPTHRQHNRQLLGSQLGNCGLKNKGGDTMSSNDLFWTCVAVANGVTTYQNVNNTAVKKSRKYRGWIDGSKLKTTTAMTNGLQEAQCYTMTCDQMKAFLANEVWGTSTVISRKDLHLGIVYWPGSGTPDNRVVMLQLDKIVNEVKPNQFDVSKDCYIPKTLRYGSSRRRQYVENRGAELFPDYQCATPGVGVLGVHQPVKPKKACSKSQKGHKGPCANGQKCWFFSGLGKDPAFKRSCQMH